MISNSAQWTGGTSVTFSGTSLNIQSNLKSLGMYLDRNLSYDTHINRLSGSCYVHILALKHTVRPYLTQDIANKLACSTVFSRLDYCNSLFYGISSRNLSRLQRIQNSLSRVVAQPYTLVETCT